MSKLSASTVRSATKVVPVRGVRGSRRSVRAKAVPLPDLPYDYGALEVRTSGTRCRARAHLHAHTHRLSLSHSLADAFFRFSSFAFPKPYISGDIMQLHHQMHHGTYVKVRSPLLFFLRCLVLTESFFSFSFH